MVFLMISCMIMIECAQFVHIHGDLERHRYPFTENVLKIIENVPTNSAMVYSAAARIPTVFFL